MKPAYREIHADLVRRSGNGDQTAQFELYKLYNKAMYNTAHRIVQDSMQAEELMHDGFMAAFRKSDQWKGDASFGAWLKRIVVNECLNHLGRKKLETTSIDEENAAQVADDSTIPATYDVAEVKKEIAHLPDGYRVVLSLYLLEGYDHEEIGEILNISSATSRSQYLRAKKRLVENLKEKNYVRPF